MYDGSKHCPISYSSLSNTVEKRLRADWLNKARTLKIMFQKEKRNLEQLNLTVSCCV